MFENRNVRLLFSFLSGVILLFIIAPIAGMYLAENPIAAVQRGFDKELVSSIWLTIGTAMLATLIFGALAIPLAYLLARREFVGKRIVSGLVDLPIVIPHSAAGIALLGVFSRDTIIGKAGSVIGLHFVGAPAGIIIAMAFVSLPFLINAARDGFLTVPPRLEKAALTLGASPLQVFFTISLPLAMRQIISGAIMMFSRGMSEFGAVVIVAYHPMIAPVMIWERFASFGLLYARPAALIFISISLIVFIIMRLVTKGGKHVKD